MKKYNVGIIGYSWVATAHITGINKSPNAQVTAIYSSRPHDDAAESARWGSPIKTYTDLNAMLSDKSIDAVSITSHSDQHADQAIAAARAGKHIILEEPMALSWEDCLMIDAEVKKAGVKVCVCFECRYSNQFMVTKALVDTGLIADIHYAELITCTDLVHGMVSITGILKRLKVEVLSLQPVVMRWMLCFCLWLFLVPTDPFQRHQPFYQRASAAHLLSAAFGVVMLGFVTMSLVLASDAPALLHLGLYSPVLLALYLLPLRSVFAHERAMKLPDIAAAPGTPPEPHSEVGPFLMAAAVVLAAGTWLPSQGDELAQAMGWSRSFVGDTIVRAGPSAGDSH